MKTLIATLVGLALTASHAPAQPKTDGPLELYKKYVEVLAKATSLDELLPYYTKELREGLGKMPSEMKGNYLKMNKRVLKDLKVTKETVGADKAVFEMTATADGQLSYGKVTLVKEEGSWRLDDDAWATSMTPKRDARP